MSKQHIFKKKLLSWSIKNTREYSWRNTEDPWKILLLEVISQQTQLDRANKYYQKFIKKFPSPNEMSIATKKDILEMWSGLGYNSRAVRLHEASKILSRNSFDSIYPNFNILPGVGEYTKNAILSFAYKDKVITQDTNVLRIFSRFFGTKNPQKFILENQKNILKNIKSRKFNEALMDFGSKICTSKNPSCSICIFDNECKKFIQVKQSHKPAFKGSNREIRGKIIKYLLVNNNVDISSLNTIIKTEENRLRHILKKLESEGMIKIKNKKLIEISS
jgi:A/G-specific adenine glycosylase